MFLHKILMLETKIYVSVIDGEAEPSLVSPCFQLSGCPAAGVRHQGDGDMVTGRIPRH